MKDKKILRSVEEDPDRTAEELPMGEVTSTGGGVDKPKRRVSIAPSAIKPASIRRKSTFVIPPPPPEGVTFKWLLAPDVIAFYFAVTLVGGVLSGIGNFLWIFMSDELKAPTTLLGLTGPAQVVLQFPFFFFSKQVLSIFGGSITMFDCVDHLLYRSQHVAARKSRDSKHYPSFTCAAYCSLPDLHPVERRSNHVGCHGT